MMVQNAVNIFETLEIDKLRKNIPSNDEGSVLKSEILKVMVLKILKIMIVL